MVTAQQRKNEINHKQREDGMETKKKINLSRIEYGIKGTGVRPRTSRRLWKQPMIIRSGDFFVDSRQCNETIRKYQDKKYCRNLA
jgi:hypothetical protein